VKPKSVLESALMSTRRTKQTTDTPNLADLESAASPTDAPGIMPPPGIAARVRTTVDYDRVIDPNERAPNYPNDLRQLAADESDDLPEPEPNDPVTDFLSYWQRYAGYHLKVIRLPDPASHLVPGNAFNRPCRELTQLGVTTFDPLAFEQSLQILNGNSGGVFRVFLLDQNGQRISEATLDRVLIADPPQRLERERSRLRQPRYEDDYGDEQYYQTRQPPPPAPPVKSEMEQRIERMQSELFERVMLRALDPPKPEPVNPLSMLSEEDRLAMSLLQKGDLLPSIVSRITNLAQAPDKIESETWKDKLADAGINLVTHNPQIITTVTDIISRATIAVASAFAPRQQQQTVSEPIPVQPIRHHPPAQRSAPQIQPQQQRAPQMQNGLPETDQPDDHELDDDEQDEIDMIEQITQLLLTSKPLSFDDPIILDLRDAYPEKFNAALLGIASMPAMVVIQYLCSKSPLAAEMFNDARQGPHLRARLDELKALIKSTLPPEVKQELEQTETQNTPAPDEQS